MILFINACVRKESRTKRLADYLLSKFNDEIKEVILSEIDFPCVNEAFLEKRESYINNNDFSDSSFDMVKDFANADIIVIAAPYWDSSFPASLKQYIEQMNVIGLTFAYTEEGRPYGLCKAKKIYYVTTSGGKIFNSDFGYGYIKSLAENYYGISNTVMISAEELDIVGADVEKILSEAEKNIDSI